MHSLRCRYDSEYQEISMGSMLLLANYIDTPPEAAEVLSKWFIKVSFFKKNIYTLQSQKVQSTTQKVENLK